MACEEGANVKRAAGWLGEGVCDGGALCGIAVVLGVASRLSRDAGIHLITSTLMSA